MKIEKLTMFDPDAAYYDGPVVKVGTDHLWELFDKNGASLGLENEEYIAIYEIPSKRDYEARK